MSSPFLNAVKVKTTSPFDTEIKRSPVYSPALVDKKPLTINVLSASEIESTGKEAGAKLQSLSREVLNHQRMNTADQMGERLNALIKEAKGLSPEQSKGVTRIFKKILGMKEDLFSQFDTVSGRIDVLTQQLKDDLRKSEDSILSLNNLKQGVGEYCLSLNRDLELLNHSYEKMVKDFEAIPEDDVEAKTKLRSVMDMTETKITDITALRHLSLNMGQRVNGMVSTARQLVNSGTKVIDNVLPSYTANFSLYIHSLNQKKSAELLNNVVDEFNTSLQLGSELAKTNQIEAAKLSQRQLVSLDTLKIDQQNLLTTLEEVSKIHSEARNDRVQYIQEVGKMETELLTALKRG